MAFSAPLQAALPVIPCNDLAASKAFWIRLGFDVRDDHGDYVIMTGWGLEVHLQPAVEGWLIPGRNPFGVYLRTPAVSAIAAKAGDLALHPPKAQPWGMYETAFSDPDETLVKVGWPSQLTGSASFDTAAAPPAQNGEGYK